MTTPDHMPNTLSEAQRMIAEQRRALDLLAPKHGQDWGGSAFPVSDGDMTDWGMTLRDYFAGQALASMASFHNGRAFDPVGHASTAYEFADAMLAARVAS